MKPLTYCCAALLLATAVGLPPSTYGQTLPEETTRHQTGLWDQFESAVSKAARAPRVSPSEARLALQRLIDGASDSEIIWLLNSAKETVKEHTETMKEIEFLKALRQRQSEMSRAEPVDLLEPKSGDSPTGVSSAFGTPLEYGLMCGYVTMRNDSFIGTYIRHCYDDNGLACGALVNEIFGMQDWRDENC